MKQAIHPKWFKDALVTCACGNSFTIGAVKPEIKVEICYKCHPFFTGEMRFVDQKGRVLKFQEKLKEAESQASVLALKKKKKEERMENLRNPKSLKDMLMGVK